jgi:hypothetical protein
MEGMNSDIQLMKTKHLLAKAKAEEQRLARRACAAAAPDVPVRPTSPASLAAGQGQGGEGETDHDPMGFDSPQDHDLSDAYREAMRAREGRTAHRSALPDDDRLYDQAVLIHKLEVQISMAKDKSMLTDKYYGCQDTDQLLNYIQSNSLLAFSSRLLSLLTAPGAARDVHPVVQTRTQAPSSRRSSRPARALSRPGGCSRSSATPMG